jgi:hypothetical protein
MNGMLLWFFALYIFHMVSAAARWRVVAAAAAVCVPDIAASGGTWLSLNIWLAFAAAQNCG